MQETNMREKLEKIIAAYEELQAKMGDSAVLANQKEYNRLAKEYASQGPLVKQARAYVQAENDLAAAKEMLSDPDMKEFAQEEIAEIEARLPGIEEEVKFMLIPADPADEKDIIVEIRSGAGGDEAALFAGDLFKMYEHFAQLQGWKIETLDVSPSEAGGYKEIQFKVKGDHVYSVTDIRDDTNDDRESSDNRGRSKAAGSHADWRRQIGRASCRERCRSRWSPYH